MINVLIYSSSKSFNKTQFYDCISIFLYEKTSHQSLTKISTDFSLRTKVITYRTVIKYSSYC